MRSLRTILFLTLFLLLFAGSFAVVSSKTHPKGPSNDIELFVTSWCPYCQQAEAYLDGRGLSYRRYDVEADEAAAKRKNRLTGRSGVPFALINGVAISGWSEGAYAAALKQGD